MWQQLSKLTGFNSDLFTANETVKEASRKFVGTWCVINGELNLIQDITPEGILTNNTNFEPEDIETIETWMPETGIYESEKSYYFLNRLPKKQWKKSFAAGENYEITPIFVKKQRTNSIPGLFDDERNNPDIDRNWILVHDFLIYKFHVVGKATYGIITVLDHNFYQEVKDKWHKRYQIILT